VESGQVRYVFRNFPLLSIHPQAQKAAEAAECAGEQGAYWEMHGKVFESQEQWSGKPDAEDIFKELAAELELDQSQFDTCLDDGLYADRVASDIEEGMGLGVSGTPHFLVNGLELSGAQPFESFQQQIEYFLAGGEAPSAEVEADNYRSLGEPDAPVVVTEYSDYQ
jgi:protein-disulfide isomerase